MHLGAYSANRCQTINAGVRRWIKPLYVHAQWDDEANVWVASSDGVPGLATEADTTGTLVQKLKMLIP